MRLCAVSIDLDEIHHYFDLYGMRCPEGAAGLGYDVGLLRAASFAEALDVPLTLFAVGRDLARPGNAAALGALARRGHAVENHSLSHRYDLATLDRNEIRAEIGGGAEAITRVTGRRPRGFRAPGYTVNERVFDVLEELGVAWDSSVFPCPAYYAAKAVALFALRAKGRRSSSTLDSPCVLGAPRRPYRPRGSLIELPIQVTPTFRLPVIGTSLAVAGAGGARRLVEACIGEELVNLELHLLDFLDRADGLERLIANQPDLAIPLGRRLTALEAAVSTLRAAGYAFVLLDEAADAFAGAGEGREGARSS